MRRAANADAAQREQLLAVAERLERQLGQLHEQRSRWALLAPPNTPDYWIASYESLVALTEQLLSDMQAELPRLSAGARRELLMSDMPELRRQLAAYRSELRTWQKRQLNASLQRGGGRHPGPGPRPRLTVVDVSHSTPDSLGFAEER